MATRRSSALERSPALVVLAFAVVGAFVALWFPHAARVAALAALRHKAETQARLVAFSVAPAIDFGDVDAVREAFGGAERDVDFVGLRALDVDGREIARLGSVEPGEDRVAAELPIDAPTTTQASPAPLPCTASSAPARSTSSRCQSSSVKPFQVSAPSGPVVEAPWPR